MPWEVTYLECRTAEQVADAIRDMVVRGAPAIGITAAYGVVLAAQQHHQYSAANWQETIRPDLDILAASRPTAVNLFWALARMQQVMASTSTDDPLTTLIKAAKSIHDEDIAANRRMGEMGAALIEAISYQLVEQMPNATSIATWNRRRVGVQREIRLGDHALTTS